MTEPDRSNRMNDRRRAEKTEIERTDTDTEMETEIERWRER